MGFGGPTLALGLIAVTYAAAAFCLGTIRRPRGQFPRLGPLFLAAWSGVVRVVRQPTLRGLAVAYSLYEVSWGILVVTVPVFAARQFAGGTGSAIAGLLWAGLGLVGGIAALIAGHRRTAGRERKVMVLGMLATAAAAWPTGGRVRAGRLGTRIDGVRRCGRTDRRQRADATPTPDRSGGVGTRLVRVDESEHGRRTDRFRARWCPCHVVTAGDVCRGRVGFVTGGGCRRVDPGWRCPTGWTAHGRQHGQARLCRWVVVTEDWQYQVCLRLHDAFTMQRLYLGLTQAEPRCDDLIRVLAQHR